MVYITNKPIGYTYTSAASYADSAGQTSTAEKSTPHTKKNMFDAYYESKAKRPDINDSCYWDKRSLKMKADIEKAVAKVKVKKQMENDLLNKEYDQKKMAESSNRRSNSDRDLYVL